MVSELIGDSKFKDLIEIGHGTGIFLPELSKKTENLYGIDIIDNVAIVSEILRNKNIHAKLFSGDIMKLPFADKTFDCVVCISVLEERFINLEKAISEISRVLKNDGTAILGFPTKNIHINFFFRLAGANPDIIHPSSHGQILQNIAKYFTISKLLKFPAFLPQDLGLYLACRCCKR